ncbi:hypothetical protein N825_18670 [Skermanella stibiiresistens SB22]|uniref:CsbD-like domain-containing protein n=1 Tax=Skermanella stibiiresistens SB22 TaxID=1385369 RepID=W9H8G2_9PROT|nr:hypothetical protein [Skermanella stibiiresistens]EWY42314.1 hypothetical protein N825_18670 [Skermanella stibiiresistens SB22]
MNFDVSGIELNWSKYKELAVEKWHRIPRARLDDLQGTAETLIADLAEAVADTYAMSREQAHRDVADWVRDASAKLGAAGERAARARAEAAASLRNLAPVSPAAAKAEAPASPPGRPDPSQGGRVRRVERRDRNHSGLLMLLAVGTGILIGRMLSKRR